MVWFTMSQESRDSSHSVGESQEFMEFLGGLGYKLISHDCTSSKTVFFRLFQLSVGPCNLFRVVAKTFFPPLMKQKVNQNTIEKYITISHVRYKPFPEKCIILRLYTNVCAHMCFNKYQLKMSNVCLHMPCGQYLKTFALGSFLCFFPRELLMMITLLNHLRVYVLTSQQTFSLGLTFF